jgi:hypothetical protein
MTFPWLAHCHCRTHGTCCENLAKFSTNFHPCSNLHAAADKEEVLCIRPGNSSCIFRPADMPSSLLEYDEQPIRAISSAQDDL